MELYRNGHMVKNMYNSPALTCELVATNIPHVWIEHLKLTDRTVLIVNDELGGFDMDTRSDTIRYSIIEKTFPEIEKVGCRLSGCIEIEDDGTIEKLKNFSL